jgi:hypothetical protein
MRISPSRFHLEFQAGRKIMRVLSLLALVLTSAMWAQNSTTSKDVPRVVHYSGTISSPDSSNRAVGVTFAFYGEQTGGSPLWLETQNVFTDSQGNFSVLLGSASKEGIPTDLFLSNQARWLGIRAEGQDEQPRILLVSAPYALKAADAETLGGRPAADYVSTDLLNAMLANPAGATAIGSQRAETSSVTLAPVTASAPSGGGTANFLSKWLDSSTLGNSSLFDTGTKVGIGTTAPVGFLDVFTDGAAGYLALTPFNINIFDKGFLVRSARGPKGSPTAVTSGDTLFNLYAQGYFGSEYGISGGISMQVDGTVSPSIVPGRIGFQTMSSDGTYAERMVVTSQGNVGIGTGLPANKLSVAGTIESTNGGFRFPDGSTLTSAASPSFSGNTSTQLLSVVQSGTGMAGTFTASNGSQTIYSIQNGAGIDQPNSAGVPNAIRGDSTTNSGVAAGVLGTSASYLGYGILGINLANCPPAPPKPQPDPCNAVGAYGWSANGRHGTGVWGQAAADVGDNVGVFGQALGDDGTGVFGYAPNTASTSTAVGVYGLSDAPKGTGVFGEVTSSTGTTAALYGRVTSSSGIGGQFDVATGANILVGRSGTVTPGLDPDVTQVFHVTSAGDFYGHSFNPGGADFAESVDVLGGPSRYEPGDVLMVDDSGVRRFALSNEAYSSKIAGIYSTQPGVLASLHSDSSGRPKGEVPLAVVGIVPCKVSAENGAIKAGDLLVASSKPGYAMKGTDRSKMLGAVVGKALGSLDKDTGVIEVLVSLH